MFVRNAVVSYLKNEPKRLPGAQLWVSDLGRHPAGALDRIRTQEMKSFDTDVLQKMKMGAFCEALPREALRLEFPGVFFDFPLYDGLWTGRADVVIAPATASPVIVEVKTTSDRWWDYRDSLPRPGDICQVWMYGYLYHGLYGVWPQLVLYYQAWNQWAEFLIKPDDVILGEGWIQDRGEPARKEERWRRVAPNWLRLELEGLLAGEGEEPAGDPSWDYAEESYKRLERIYGGVADPFADWLKE